MSVCVPYDGRVGGLFTDAQTSISIRSERKKIPAGGQRNIIGGADCFSSVTSAAAPAGVSGMRMVTVVFGWTPFQKRITPVMETAPVSAFTTGCSRIHES